MHESESESESETESGLQPENKSPQKAGENDKKSLPPSRQPFSPRVLSHRRLHPIYNASLRPQFLPKPTKMASPSSSASNEVPDGNPVPPPPHRWPIAPPPPAGHAVYVEQLYNDPPPRRPFLRREMSFICRSISWGLVVCLMASSFSVLMWLIFHPVFPQLHVASATMSSVATTSTDVGAECNITFILTNPNRHLTAIYDRMEISLLYPSQGVLLSQDYPPPFSQPKKSRTTIESDLSFNGVYLGADVLKAMKQDLDRGSLSFGIRILAIVRYKSGKWKTRSQFMRAYCGGVSFGFTSDKNPGIFLNPYQECEVYLYSK